MTQVPTVNMVAMTVSLLICFGVPFALSIYMKRCLKASLRSMLLGALTFVIFALVLERLVHMAVLHATGSVITNSVWATAVYGGLAAGIFEETGRLFTMRVLLKKRLAKNEALMYGVGHGGIEAILIGGMVCISNLVTSVMINQGQMESMLSAAGEVANVDTIRQNMMQLVDLPSWQFLLVGGERFTAMLLQICLSYLVYLAVTHHSWKYFGVAVLIHALVDALTVIATQYFASILAVELVLFVAVLGFVIWTVHHYRREPLKAEAMM